MEGQFEFVMIPSFGSALSLTTDERHELPRLGVVGDVGGVRGSLRILSFTGIAWLDFRARLFKEPI